MFGKRPGTLAGESEANDVMMSIREGAQSSFGVFVGAEFRQDLTDQLVRKFKQGDHVEAVVANDLWQSVDKQLIVSSRADSYSGRALGTVYERGIRREEQHCRRVGQFVDLMRQAESYKVALLQLVQPQHGAAIAEAILLHQHSVPQIYRS